MTFERPAECRFRAIPEAIGHFTQAEALFSNPTTGEVHPPPCHVLHWSRAHEPRETLGEDRPRQVDLCREGTDGPWFLGSLVNQRQCMPDVRIN